MVSQAPYGVNERVRCWRSSSVKNSLLAQTLDSFIDVPKTQTLTTLKAQKREGLRDMTKGLRIPCVSWFSLLLGVVWLATKPSSSELLKAHLNDFIDQRSQGSFDTGERELVDRLLQARIVPEAARQIMTPHGRFVGRTAIELYRSDHPFV